MKEDESEEDENMKKTYKIDVDCANCANKMEEAAKNTSGVKDATVNFMTLKMIVEFEDGAVYLLSLKVVPSLVSTSSTPRSLNSLRIRSASA